MAFPVGSRTLIVIATGSDEDGTRSSAE